MKRNFLIGRLARLGLVMFILLSSLPTQPQTASAAAPRVGPPVKPAAPAAVGLNSISLSGSAPGGFINNSYVEIPSSAALNPSGGSITIEAWVKRNDSTRCETLVGNNFTTSYWLGFCTAKLRFYPHGSGSEVDSNGVVPAGVWSHVAVTYDGFTRRYYINGVLDTTSTANSGSITPAPNGQSLGIGFDIPTTFTQNYFSGLIQDVRIWNTVRTAAQIRASMYQTFGAPQSGLLAEWRFAGDLNDPAGGHNGIAQTTAVFSADGAIPHDIRIPQVSATPTLDGSCNTQTKYANAAQVVVGGANVYLMHTATQMWVCFQNLLSSTAPDNWAAVYLDVNHTRVDPAQPDHLSLEVHSTGTVTRTRVGDAVGNYVVTSTLGSLWNGVYINCCGEFPTRSAEFVISSTLLGGWSHVIGLALAQHWITGVGDDRLWPALAVWNLPSTWSNATLGGTGGPYTFNGQVLYQPRGGGTLPGIPGVGINLVGSDPSGGEAVVGTIKTALDGSFSLTSDDDYARHRLEMDTWTLPRGYVPVTATASLPGVVVDARTINYGAVISGTYSSAVFQLGDAKPYVLDSTYNPYFLIVATQSIISGGALNDFVDFKQRLGFQVEVLSLETINSSFGGADIGAKIRAAEINRHSTYGSRFKYVLLVGAHPTIPVRFMNPWSISTADCMANAGPPTDWYYADLTTNWDSNGNGCLADGIWSDPTKRASGYTPDSGIAFQPTVAVGRLPFSSAAAVRTALGNSIAFEQQADSFKGRTLQAASMMDYQGRCWNPPGSPTGAYTTSGCDHITGSGTDGSYLAQAQQNGFLTADHYSLTPFYENEHPATGSSPAHLISPLPVTEPNVTNEMNSRAYGLVNLVGHGNGDGVYRLSWVGDSDLNGIPEQPSAPPQNQYEIDWRNLLTNGGVSTVTPRNSNSAIFVTASCSTGQYDYANSLGAQLLSQGHGVAWVGGLDVVIYYFGWQSPNNGPYGGMMDMDYFFTQRLLDKNLRLGDAFWQAMQQYMANGNQQSTGLVYDLYGDPTLSYWGNPSGQSMLDAWPMLRQDAYGHGYVTLSGPGVPKQLWSYSATAPGMGTLPPSPVVSNDGEVVVAHGSFVDVLAQGSLYQRLSLDAAAFGTPAIAADGTIYALDVNGKLYAFKYGLWIFCFGGHCYSNGIQSPYRVRRWAINLGSGPLTSPVIGSDGMLAVARTGGNFFGIVYSLVDLVRPDGFTFREEPILGNAIGELVAGTDKVIYASTSTGTLVRIDFFCSSGTCKIDDGQATANTTPPLQAYGALYVGRSDGTVVKKSTSLATLATFSADSAITAGPVAGPGGQVLVGTQNGTLYSLSSSLSLRWSRNIGAAVQSVPAFSNDALYVASGNYLRAYDPFSGALLWLRYLGAGAGSGSASVGYGREVYVQASNGQVVAFGEGWAIKPWWVVATSVLLGSGREVRPAIQVQWSLVPPPIPGPLAGSRPQLAPAAIASIAGYLLQRSADGTDWQDVTVLPPGANLGDTLIYTDTGVTPGVSYMYRVQTLDSGGNDSDFTGSFSVNDLPQPPGRPTLDSVTTHGSGSLALSWSPGAGEVNGYRVERSLSEATGYVTATVSTGDTHALTDTGLISNTTYYYRVWAFNDAGESVIPSNVLSGTTRSRTLPAPQNVLATLLSDGRVQVSWDAGPVGATAVVEVNPDGLFGYQPLGSTTAAGPFTYDPGVPNSFGYRVKFVQGNDESDYGVTTLRVSTRGFTNAWLLRVFLPIVAR